MKLWYLFILLVALFILGCDGNNHGGNNTTGCPVTCTLGCLPDNVTCRSPADLCANVTCSDKCEDSGVLDTNGECDSATGQCVYKKLPCIFGCFNGSCSSEPLCPVNCPFGCEPGTDVCVNPTCPSDCTYGCIPGTLQCNAVPPSSGIKNGDFEDGYQGWNTTGNAFGSAPTSADYVNSQKLYRNVPYSGYSGAYFASSYFPQMDKGAMGTLTSEPFFINKDYLEFLVVADYSGQVYVDLIVNDTVVYHLEPDNSYPPFERITWNVSDYRGQSGVINVVDLSDRASIDVDDFMLVNTPSKQPGQPYIDTYGKFLMVPPRNWIIVQPGMPGEVFFYGSKDNNFTINLLVISEKVNSNDTTESYFSKGKTGFSLLLQNYSSKSETNVNIGGLDAKQIDYTYTLLGQHLESREVFLVRNGIGYKISATSAEASFSTHLDEFSNSMSSFRIIYTNATYNIAITYPPTWQVSEGLLGSTVTFMGPKDGNFTPNCNVGEENVQSNTTLSEYVNDAKTTLSSTLSNYTLLSEGDRTINGENGHQLISSYSMVGKTNEVQSIIILKNGIAHVITCTSSKELFGKYEPVFESVITSFRFIS
jgi:hypothetical protein